MKQYVSRIMEHGPRSTLAGSRRRDRMCVRNTNCVSGTNRVSDTHNIHIYQSLTQLCVRCVRCVSFFNLFGGLLKNTFLFYKSYFNLKLPDTLDTHLYNPRQSSLSYQKFLTHMLTRT